MWTTIREKLRDWYILLIALCFIAGGMFVASREIGPTGSTASTPAPNTQPQTQANAGAPGRKPTAAPQTPRAAQTPPAQPSQTAQANPLRSQPAAPQASASAPYQHGTAGDAAGRQVFRKCQACHSMEPGKNILGPSLAGIMGRKAAAEAGFNYSPAMKQANISWDAKTLDVMDVIAFLASAGRNAQAATPAASAPPPASAPQAGAAATSQPRKARRVRTSATSPMRNIPYAPE